MRSGFLPASPPGNAVLPHLGGATLETRTAIRMLVLDNRQDFLEGRDPLLLGGIGRYLPA